MIAPKKEENVRDQKRYDKNGGLLNPVRNISGEVIGGTDPQTGASVYRGPGHRKMSSPTDRASAFEREQERQLHAYDPPDGVSRIKDDPSNYANFDNYFGTDKAERQGWMNKRVRPLSRAEMRAGLPTGMDAIRGSSIGSGVVEETRPRALDKPEVDTSAKETVTVLQGIRQDLAALKAKIGVA